MNREALPLIVAVTIPVVLVLLILLYSYGYDITLFFRKLPIIYYIIIFPLALGFIVALFTLGKEQSI